MLTEFSTQLADIVAAAAPSVVQVKGRRAPASGLIYAPGVVLTTMRGLGRESGLQVRQNDGRVADAELGGWDPATGLAVLRATGIDAPAFVPSTQPVSVGHLGIAVARSWSNAVTASAGIVAIIGGPLRTGRHRSIDKIFRTTAPMHDGFAGGAFVDTSGKLVGITTASSIRGLGVVIPSPIAWEAAANVLEHGRVRRGYVGIAGQPVSLAPQQREVAGRERGLLVVGVVSDGPAARAEVLVGDIILMVDETPLDSPEQLMDLLMSKASGTIVKMQMIRGTRLTAVVVTIGERPVR